jgi:pyruvate formate lyase activating enzyme
MASASISLNQAATARCMREADLVVGGLTPFTTIDFPGHLAAVVFCQGCPWRCPYCHNPHLHPAQGGERSWRDVRDWLQTRRGLLDGVVFSGGEPLLQRGLVRALGNVRALGFSTGLPTAGIYPERLVEALPLLDWVGFDVKGPFQDYGRITGGGIGESTERALSLLLEAGTPHEIRCTVDPELLDADAIRRMTSQLVSRGVSALVLQTCRRDGRQMQLPSALVQAAVAAMPRITVRGS